eukprot:TRINITY_DN12738_c0_g1_i1.p1 TRINITY_DN12738_c0_g1~~TRINITY_DN12738_c0_g1_i1.p1  ORF type:complete len:472 (+),score=60.23 TRINITY_DN12738_c0_g1_i1:76-1491(+)
MMKAAWLLAVLTATSGAGTRPFFQYPGLCAQIWDASTYDGHWPDQDSIDTAERDVDTSANLCEGQPITAAAAGTVSKVYVKNDENRVFLDHGNGWTTHYIHLQSLPPLNVGDTIAQGQVLGHCGNSGTEAMHLHFTELADDAAVRSAFNGQLIDTHAGNTDSWNTWGTSNAEEILSNNCLGEKFVTWTQFGLTYHLIYKPQSGLVKIVRNNGPGTGFSTVFTTTWTQQWTHMAHYKIGGSNYVILYKASTGRVGFIRLNIFGWGHTNLAFGYWGKRWTNLVPFYRGGHPYLLVYNSLTGHANIEKFYNSGAGTTNVYQSTWIKGRTELLFYNFGATQYLMLYIGSTGNRKVFRVDGSNTWLSFSHQSTATTYAGYSHWATISRGGSTYIFAYKQSTGFVKMYYPLAGTTFYSRYSSYWTKSWTHISPFLYGGDTRLFIYKTGTGNVKTIGINSGAWGITQLYSTYWTKGWN